MDYAPRRVTLDGNTVALTATEYRMLVELSANAGLPLTHQHLLQRVWELEPGADLRPVRTVLANLRHKLGDDADNPLYIHTEPRVGYRMALPDAAEPDGLSLS